MVREIRAKYSKGKIEPLEDIDLREGEEITITIQERRSAVDADDAFVRAAAAWKGTLDFDLYLKDLYAARRHPSRVFTM